MRPNFFLASAILAKLASSAPASVSVPLRVRDEERDGTDLSYIKKIAAVGDSYSAGIGAGERLQGTLSGAFSKIFPLLGDDWKCSRYGSSYPSIVNRIFFGDKKDNFQFLSCSGALADEVTDGQVPMLKGDQDVILVSAGGNDAELVWVLNHCVFQFFSPTEAALDGLEVAVGAALSAAGEPLIAEAVDLWLEHNKEKLTRGCDKQLEVTENIIKSDAFGARIEKLIDKSKEKLKKDTGTLVYTGYAKFWDTDIVDNDYCSKTENSWSMFYNVNDPTKIVSDKAFLTKERRQKMNSLVDLMNKRIGDIVESKASKNGQGQADTIFANYDEYYGDLEGRFCTKGADKPEKDRTADLTFYPLDFTDPFGSTNFKRSEAIDVYNGTFEGDIDFLTVLADAKGLRYRQEVPLVKAKAKALSASTKANEAQAVKAADDATSKLRKRSYLPDGFGRTFHPTIGGHNVIAKFVLWKLAERNARGLKIEYGPEVGALDGTDSCPGSPNDLPELSPKCTGAGGRASNLPANVFYLANQKQGVFDEFCKQIDEKKLDDSIPHKWTVNAKGEHQTGSSRRKRTPPPDASSHKEMINLDWTPNKKNHNCKASCAESFAAMAQSQCGRVGGGQDLMAVEAQYNNGCGVFSYKITGDGVPDAEPTHCYYDPVQAPKGDREVEDGKGTSVDVAYKNFCDDIDGKTLGGSPDSSILAHRYDITRWGVEKRASFWVIAEKNGRCQGNVKIDKDTCLKKMRSGLSQCKENSGYTNGFIASSECVDYSVKTTFLTTEHAAPGKQGSIRVEFPPPEDIDGIKPKCSQGSHTRPLADDDLNKAIDYYCQNGGEIKGFGKYWEGMVDYPPKNQPQFYPNDNLIYHLTMGATTVNQGDPQPYQPVGKDGDWCKNYDWKLNKDDCTYALRKLHHECRDGQGQLLGGDYTYRCVHYKSWGVNCGRQGC